MNGNVEEILKMKPHSSKEEIGAYQELIELMSRSPIPKAEVLANLGLFLPRASLSRLLFMHEFYQHILDVPGVVMEFGARWGQNLALFSSFRNIYEPHNYSRKIIGFDTFAGFPDVSQQDGSAQGAKSGAYSVTEGYKEFLENILSTHERLSPRGHLRRFEVIQGDVQKTLPAYIKEHPETVIALAYFDLDIYEPTKHCLEEIKGRLTKGSVVGFDELNLAEFPGETSAIQETLGLSRIRLKRGRTSHYESYFIVE